MKLTDEQIRELCDKATEGPWEAGNYGAVCLKSGFKLGNIEGPGNAAFIARSRTLIPELCDALEKANAEIERLRKAQRWIPVTERLPQIDVAVLVLHTYQRDEYSPITIGRLYQPCDKRRNPYWTFVSIQASDGAVYNDGTDFICPGSEYVTHWRPLPAPSEEGKKP